MAIPFSEGIAICFLLRVHPLKKTHATKVFFTLPPHFHSFAASLYSSAFPLLWKQIKKVEAKFASTITKCYRFSVIHLLTP